MTYLVGSRHEGYGETGMAHLLEHMLFKETKTGRDVKKELSELSVLLTKEQGKPVGDSQREIEHFLHGMNFYAGLASKIRGSV